MAFDFDLLTIGAGSGGVAGTRRAAAYGARTAIIEDVRVGGTCVLRGCVPKKLLVYGAGYSDAFEDAVGFGWSVGQPQFDWGKLIAAKDRELDRLHGIYIGMLEKPGVKIINGRGVLVDGHTVDVGGQRFTAERIMIATGGHATRPDIPGAELGIISDGALDLKALPKRAIIVGAGYIAVEFAGIFRSAGVDVTMVYRGELPLRGFDGEVRAHMAEAMASRGVKLRGGVGLSRLDKIADGLRLTLADGSAVDGDVVLFATGRKPNTRNLGLEAAGVKTNADGAILVDQNSRTSLPSVYAVGDVTDRLNLTPIAIAEARALAETHFNGNPMTVAYDNVPTAVFGRPEIGVVGLSEEDALKAGLAVDIYTTRFRPMRNVISGRDEKTFMKLVVNAQSGVVLGCHMVGPDAAEIVQGLAIALVCGATKAQFDRTIGLHPSAAEEFVTLRDKRPPR
ncbi:MAG: glutathione-disulfide reductase [Elsteraceae bacterium]